MINIAVAADLGYAKQLGVVLGSLAASQSEPYRVFVLHAGYPDELRGRVESCAGPAPAGGVSWTEVDVAGLTDVRLPPYLTTASVFRLLLPEFLPADTRRVVYLDADVLVRSSLGPLWRTDLRGRAVGAVRDAVVPWVGSPRGMPWRELGMAPGSPYVNTGVLVIELDAWRRGDVSGRALALMRQFQLRHGDQCAIRGALDDHDILQLSPRWNVQAGHLLAEQSSAWLVEDTEELDEALRSPAVVHFNTSPLGRPWLVGCVHPWRAEWLAVLDHGSWANWRPSRWQELYSQLREPNVRRRALQRLQVAGRALVRGE